MPIQWDEATVVTGSPRPRGPGPGERIGGRYDLRQPMQGDPFSLRFRALDLATESPVQLRWMRPELFGDATAQDEFVERLKAVAGAGGRYLPGLLDVGIDGPNVFVVEPWPTGVSLRKLLDRRRAQGFGLTPDEVLGLVARLSAALEALPGGFPHGDVRIDHVYVAGQRLELFGAFVLPALPLGSLEAALLAQPAIRKRLPPETNEGTFGSAGDRHGVGVIAWEAFTGLPPGSDALALPSNVASLAEPLRALIDPDPRSRARTLTPLLEALGALVGRSEPPLDPAPFRRNSPSMLHREQADTVPAPPPQAEEAPRPDPTEPIVLEEMLIDEPLFIEVTEETAPVPDDIKPIPRPRRPSELHLAPLSPTTPALYDDSTSLRPPSFARESTRPAIAAPREPLPRHPLSPPIPAPRARRAVKASPAPETSGAKIVLTALVAAIVIITASLGVAFVRKRAAEDEIERRLLERYERLQRESELRPPEPSSAEAG